MLRIGDFSKLTNVSVKALRFYDEIGLLKPTYVDRETGYRYYAANLLSRLNRILIFKELGFSLEEIVFLIQEDLPASQVHDALRSKRTELSCRIAQEQARLAQIEAWLTQIEREGRAPDYEIMLKQVPPQLVASVRNRIDSYEAAAELFAEVDRHLKKYNAAGQCAAIWHTCAGQGKHIDCEAMVFLNDIVPENNRIRIYELPAGTEACIVHQGNDETVEQAYTAVRSWIKAHGYRIAGPNRELYWRGNIAQDDSSNVTEIRFPILKPQLVTSAKN
jgi:DNA-binding transcriptional MerR regulator